MDLLPIETVENIVQYLDTRQKKRFGQTCKGAYSLTNYIIYQDNVPEMSKRAPLTWGIVTHQVRVVQLALAAGADPNASDWLSLYYDKLPISHLFNTRWKCFTAQASGSLLHFAGIANNVKAAIHLLQHGAIHDEAAPSNWGNNMCPCYRQWQSRENVKYLPLHTAACHQSIGVMRVLLNHGASVRRQCARLWDFGFHFWKETLLHSLVKLGPGHLAVIEMILQLPQSDINSLIDGRTPLDSACDLPNNGEVIRRLMKVGARPSWPNRAARDHGSKTAIARCLGQRSYENALVLLELDAYGFEDIQSATALLFFCAFSGNGAHSNDSEYPVPDMSGEEITQFKRIISILVNKYGLDLNDCLFNGGDTALTYVIGLGNKTDLASLIPFLISSGARLDKRNNRDHNAIVSCLWTEALQPIVMSGPPGNGNNEALLLLKNKGPPFFTAIRQALLLLIQACREENIDMDARYHYTRLRGHTWVESWMCLWAILMSRFPDWRPSRQSTNQGLWDSLLEHVSRLPGFSF